VCARHAGRLAPARLATDLYAPTTWDVNFWTRPGGTNFNVSTAAAVHREYKTQPVVLVVGR